MSYLIEKPKHKPDLIKRHYRFANLLALVTPSTQFEFQLDQSLNTCAARLKAYEHDHVSPGLTSLSASVEITWQDADTYRFCIHKIHGRETSILATGCLSAVSSEKTLVSGTVRDDNWLSILVLIGLVAFFAVMQFPAASLFIAVFIAVSFLNFFTSATERHRFIDYIRNVMVDYANKPKRLE